MPLELKVFVIKKKYILQAICWLYFWLALVVSFISILSSKPMMMMILAELTKFRYEIALSPGLGRYLSNNFNIKQIC